MRSNLKIIKPNKKYPTKEFGEYPNFYTFYTAELTNLSPDMEGIKTLSMIVDILNFTDDACKRNNWGVSEKIEGCSVMLIELIMKLFREELNHQPTGDNHE